jgi:hypothetical protein
VSGGRPCRDRPPARLPTVTPTLSTTVRAPPDPCDAVRAQWGQQRGPHPVIGSECALAMINVILTIAPTARRPAVGSSGRTIRTPHAATVDVPWSDRSGVR